MYLHLSPLSLNWTVVVAYVGVAAVAVAVGLAEDGPLEDVVDDGPGEVSRGREDGRVVEDAHLVARDLVVLLEDRHGLPDEGVARELPGEVQLGVPLEDGGEHAQELDNERPAGR